MQNAAETLNIFNFQEKKPNIIGKKTLENIQILVKTVDLSPKRLKNTWENA